MIDSELLKKISEGFQKFAGLSDTGFIKIASFGWYVDADMPLGYTTGLMEKAIEGDKEYLDTFFVDYYRTSIKDRTKSFIRKHNERIDIIKEGIDCHNDKKYYASTILFLSQADGICGGFLFKTGNKKKELKKFLSTSVYGSFFLTLINSIKYKNAVDSFYPEESVNYESELNRHGVMHGYNSSFGTEENSLKAFSLLCFVNDFVHRH